jgi:hypothetical protein
MSFALLADAIERGAVKRPQSFGSLFDTVVRDAARPDVRVGSCALGAAVEGAGLVVILPGEWTIRRAEDGDAARTTDLYIALRHRFPVLSARVNPCPVCHEDHGYLKDLIAHFNDDHRETRERIAARVREMTPAAEGYDPMVDSDDAPVSDRERFGGE